MNGNKNSIRHRIDRVVFQALLVTQRFLPFSLSCLHPQERKMYVALCYQKPTSIFLLKTTANMVLKCMIGYLSRKLDTVCYRETDCPCACYKTENVLDVLMLPKVSIKLSKDTSLLTDLIYVVLCLE